MTKLRVDVDNIHNHFYYCENCGTPLGVHDGNLVLGVLLCNECMKFTKLTTAGKPFPPPSNA